MKRTTSVVNKMRTYFKKNRADSYPISGHPLEKEDEHLKSLYITMICVIMNNNDDTYEERRFFVQRLIKGIGLNEEIDYYDKKSLEIDDKFIEEYVKQFCNNDLKYNFLVDSLIMISSRGTPDKKDLDFVCEIYDVLAIEKGYIEMYCSLVNCVLEQNVEKLKCDDVNLSVDKINRYEYLYKNFFNGKLIDNGKELYIYSNSRTLIDICSLIKDSKRDNFNIIHDGDKSEINISNTDIIFENLEIDLTKIQLTISVSNKVEFKNCMLYGECINIKDCNQVVIDNCKFVDFSNRVLYFDGITVVDIENSVIERCSIKNDINNNVNGGVVYFSKVSQIIISKCRFNRCLSSGYKIYGLIGYCDSYDINNLEIHNNVFKNCKSESSYGLYNYGLFNNMYSEIHKIENNIIENCNVELGIE